MNGTVKRPNNDYRRSVGKQNNKIYVYGNTVRQMNAVPQRRTGRTRQQQQQKTQTKKLSATARRKRIRARQITMPYVVFLSAVVIVSLAVCINYVQLKSANTTYHAELVEKETSINEAKMLNDATYEKLMASIDLNYVRDVAINKLGMVYAQEGQIITYSSQESDYIKQYSDVPTK